jgi:hypothetical protein
LTPNETVIPRGGTLVIQITVRTNADSVGTVLFATKATTPHGTKTGYLMGPLEVYFSNPHQSKSGYKSHTIPGNAPLGTYTYHGYLGKYGTGIFHECQFDFEVIEP